MMATYAFFRRYLFQAVNMESILRSKMHRTLLLLSLLAPPFFFYRKNMALKKDGWGTFDFPTELFFHQVKLVDFQYNSMSSRAVEVCGLGL